MAFEALYRQNAGAATALQDFAIQGAAELGGCSGAQSFRAVRQADGLPVLLHKFRPAESLIALEPRIARAGPPDCTKPFVTRFTDLFVAAGSAYLVEPLPPCLPLSDIWRHLLQTRSDRAFLVITVLVRHLLSIVGRLARHNTFHGALAVENIVLAPTASFGVLAAHLECKEGRLWLRKDPDTPAKPDFRAVAEVLGLLLEIEAQMTALRHTSPLLPAPVRHSIHELLRTIEHTSTAFRRS